MSVRFDLAGIQQRLHREIFPEKGREHEEVQGGHAVSCRDVFALGRDIIVRRVFWRTPEDVMSLKALCQGHWSLFWGKGPQCWGCMAGDARCCQGLFFFPFPLFYRCRRCRIRISPQIFASRPGFTATVVFQAESPHCIRACFRPRGGCQKPKPFPEVTRSFFFSLFSGK